MAKKHKKKHENIKIKKKDRIKLPDSSIQDQSKPQDIISFIVFFFSFAIVFISLISVVFPSLVVLATSPVISGLEYVVQDPFETGVWAAPLIIVNIITFAILVLYLKNKLPSKVIKVLKFIFEFEVSKRVTFLIISALLIIYISSTANELGTEETWGDYFEVKKRIEKWSIDDITKDFEPHVTYFFLVLSMEFFGNYMVIPFLGSISLLIVTYFLTKKITNKRFASVIAVIIVIQSNLFVTYDTSVAYNNFWTLFYLLSLYLVYKAWPLSPLSYLISIPSKALTAAFLPMSLFFIFRATITRNKKIILLLVNTIMILVGASFLLSGTDFSHDIGSQEGFISSEFWMGFTSFAYQMRFDGLILLFILPLMVGLFITSRKGVKQVESIMILIVGILFVTPLLTGFTDQTNQPYRFVPLVVFFAIGVGSLLTKRQNNT